MATTTVLFLKSVSQLVSPGTNGPGNDPGSVTGANYVYHQVGDVAAIDSTLAATWINDGVCQAWTGTIVVDNSVQTSSIQNLAVTNAKMAAGAAIANIGYTPPRTFLQSTAPSSPIVTDIWIDNTVPASPLIKIYNGVAWKTITTN